MKIDVSIGELVDKVTILSIKSEKIKNESKLTNVRKELTLLKQFMEEIGIIIDSDEFIRLKEVNLKLWNIEDEIRIKEAKQEFDEEFISLARSVYYINDDRAAIKKKINLEFGSELNEEKEYVRYK